MGLIDWYIVIKASVPCSGRKNTSEKMSVDSIQHQPPQLTLKLSLVRLGIDRHCVVSEIFHIVAFCSLPDFQKKSRSAIDPFTKRHRLVHNGGFPKFEALH